MRTVCWLVLALMAVAVDARQPAKPRVLILTTGGTIASRQDAPLIEGPALVQAVPGLLDHARIEVEEFSVIGSSKMTPSHWLSMSQRINALYDDDDDLAGIVITHGTDTLEETAWFLNLTVKSDKPVVLTGSMRSSDEVSPDGPANLINAVRVAVDGDARGRGVLVALNEDITAARFVRKTDNRRADTFTGGPAGHIGTVDPDGVRFFYSPEQPHTTRAEFDVSALTGLPDVPLLTDFTGMTASAAIHYAELPMDGLVIRTFAGGRMSAGLQEALTEIAARGLPIVVTSRVPEGRIVQAPDYPFPAVVAADLADNKARILLMLALTRTQDRDEIRTIFELY